MGATIAYGKSLYYEGNTIGLDSVVEYRDQHGVRTKINVRNLVEMAKRMKGKENKEFLDQWLSHIENNSLSIGVVIIELLGRIVSEFSMGEIEKNRVYTLAD